ncbi:hypothetical protein [Bacillus salacetis]|uniref:oxidoreductase n=1 Tax=Bacillus salacetis TaxID=2315464 RepID=UPI001F0BEA3A|nr:hypothetical protein [Bacillus salacetis]
MHKRSLISRTYRVQINGAQGYLISQLLSPYHIRRTDEWGGSLENRTRFLMEV